MKTTPEYFAEISRGIERHQPLTEDTGAWLASCLRHHLAGASLDFAFKLTEVQRRKVRDEALVRAARLMTPNRSPWQQAQRLATQVSRFEELAWPRLSRQLASKWPELSGSKLELARAFATGLPIPKTPRWLHALIMEDKARTDSTVCINTQSRFLATG